MLILNYFCNYTQAHPSKTTRRPTPKQWGEDTIPARSSHPKAPKSYTHFEFFNKCHYVTCYAIQRHKPLILFFFFFPGGPCWGPTPKLPNMERDLGHELLPPCNTPKYGMHMRPNSNLSTSSCLSCIVYKEEHATKQCSRQREHERVAATQGHVIMES